MFCNIKAVPFIGYDDTWYVQMHKSKLGWIQRSSQSELRPTFKPTLVAWETSYAMTKPQQQSTCDSMAQSE
jgi:hypothetical protein